MSEIQRHPASPAATNYLLSGQSSELQRLQLQSRVWEPAGRALMDEFACPPGARVLEAGCGVMGWLRVLADWVGPGGEVTGVDIDDRMLAMAGQFVEAEELRNVVLQKDDLFDTRLAPGAFDLVHARFQLAPLGRQREQMATFMRLLRPGGILILEDPDRASWRLNPAAPATDRVIELIEQAFAANGGDFNAGRSTRALLAEHGFTPHVRAHVLALEPGHPYLRLPLQFATALRAKLATIVDAPALDALLAEAAVELDAPGRWGTTFTLVQTYGARP
jgi:SAM-dependent methyltransferase